MITMLITTHITVHKHALFYFNIPETMYIVQFTVVIL